MKKNLWMGLLFLCCLFPMIGIAQSPVSGKVSDAQDEPLSGVSVTVRGTSVNTQTDEKGNFSVTVAAGQTVVFTMVGYETKEIVYQQAADLTLQLQIAYGTLSEVVAVGYGTVTKKEVTGSVVTVKAKDFNKGDVNNPMGLVQGKVPGLTITKVQGSDPNQGFQIQLRGLNTLSGGRGPLVIIDGIQGNNTLNMIDPNDIESIDVLKDGSAAAIYGTRATNGVILITTKRPEIGNVKFELNNFISTEVKAEDRRSLSAAEYRNTLAEYYPDRTYLDKGQDTDWFDEVTRSPLNQNWSFSASGGTRKINYRAGLYYRVDEGLVQRTSARTLTPSLFVSQTGANDKLKVDYRLMYSHVKRQWANPGVLSQAAWRNPTEPVFDPADIAHGGYYTVVTASGYLNPVAMVRERQDDVDDRYLSGDINASYQLFRGFKLTLHGSYNSKQNYAGMYQTRLYPDLGMNGNAVVYSTYTNDVLFEPGFEYKKNFKGHNIQAIGGYSYFENQYRQLWANNYNFDLDNFSYNNLGAGYALTDGLAEMTTNRNENLLISFYGRVMYSFLDKYLVSASVRHEGSSRFGVNNKWGTFPAISAGWRINEEDFMQSVPWVSNLKLRAGFGVTGNQDIPNYLSLSRLAVSSRQMYYNGTWINTYQPASNPNPDLKWERKQEYNIGVDFGLFDSRLSGSVDYYHRKVTDLLWWYAVPVPPNVYNNMYANVGSMQNKGLEVQLNYEILRSKDLSINTSVNYARNRNKLLSFSDSEKGYELPNLKVNPAATTWTQFVEEGKPLGNIMAPVFLGVDANGNGIYEDVNKDGIVNVESELDRRTVGNAYPKFELGWSGSVQYKNFDLSFFVRGVFGHSLVNYERIFYENWQPLLSGRNILRTKLENYPDYTGIPTFDSRFVEKASFVKLNNVSIGYNFKVGKAKNPFRVFATGQNLFCITDYSGTDPEVPISEMNTNTAVGGTENLTYYPFTKTFSVGFNFKF